MIVLAQSVEEELAAMRGQLRDLPAFVAMRGMKGWWQVAGPVWRLNDHDVYLRATNRMTRSGGRRPVIEYMCDGTRIGFNHLRGMLLKEQGLRP